MPESMFDLKYGVAGVCVLLTLQILVTVAKAVWENRKKKDSHLDLAIEQLTIAVEENTAAVSELPKLKVDIRRYYNAIKILAGDEWPTIRDEILAEDKIKHE